MSKRPGLVDPLKHSQPTGAALAFAGMRRCMPVMHGSQGCASFAKALHTRHFREPVPLQTTAVDHVAAVLGAGDILTATLEAIIARHQPELVGVCTTGVTETNGEDVAGELRSWLDALAEAGEATPPVVFVSTPDFTGGLSTGYGAAVAAMVDRLAEPGPTVAGRVALLPGPGLSSLDAEELAGQAAGFGLAPVLVPGLDATLDGHLDADWSPLAGGGATVDDVRGAGRAAAAIAVGEAVRPAADRLAALGVATHVLPTATGLEAGDALVAALTDHAGVPAPDATRRWRARLADGLLDAHFVLGGHRVALALEPDLLLGVTTLLAEVGAEVVTAVAPQKSRALAQVPCDEVVVGGFADAEERAAAAGAELLVASSHGWRVAERLGIPHVRLGFPITDRLGAALRPTAGYRGSLGLLTDLANAVLAHEYRRPAGGHHLPDPFHHPTHQEAVPC